MAIVDNLTPQSQAELVAKLDKLFARLIAESPDKELASELYQAAVVVAILGKGQVGRELAKRALDRGKARNKAYKANAAVAWTRRAVARSSSPRTRATKKQVETAFEEVGRQFGVSAATVEKRAYKKTK